MSTAYHPICLSHPTALLLEEVGGRDQTAALAIASHLPGHRDCDIVLGAYSYPLIRVACLPGHGAFTHSHPEWVEAGWLKLLLWARETTKPETPDADLVERYVAGAARCWPPDRLARLATLLRDSEDT